MNSLYFFILKALLSIFGIIFQFLLIETYGAKFTGDVNKIQLWAFCLSMLFFPGIEFTLLRKLPKIRSVNSKEYNGFLFIVRISFFVVGCFWIVTLIVAKIVFSNFILMILVTIATGYLFFLARLLPIFLRINTKYFYSILSEQGFIFLIASIMIFTHDWSVKGPVNLWWTICVVTLAISLIIIRDMGDTCKSDISQKISNRYRPIFESLSKDYGLPIALIAVSNFALLWMPATVGTFLLSSEDIAISMSMIRLIGLLLFVEGAMSAYFLPKISAAVESEEKTYWINKFRMYITYGTCFSVILIMSAVILYGSLNLDRSTILIFAAAAGVQIFVCFIGSPFSIATILATRAEIGKVSKTMIFFSVLGVILLIIFSHWQVIIFQFIILQLIRAFLGLKLLSSG